MQRILLMLLKPLENYKTILGLLGLAGTGIAAHLGYLSDENAKVAFRLLEAWTGYGIYDKLSRVAK